MEIGVDGFGGKRNQLLCYCPARPVRNVIYFPGDTQDLCRIMEGEHEGISKWKEFCLEETLSLLKVKFPESAVWIIRPHTMLRQTFSCYHNFVKSSIVGTPSFDRKPNAVPHLEQLLQNAVGHMTHSLETPKEEVCHLPITLIGFSKGCIVLNQLVHEMGNYLNEGTSEGGELEVKDKERLATFLRLIKEIYWLDSGHSGEAGCWIIERELMQYLVELNVKVHVHVSPHQMTCPQRPWIADEEREFVETLREMGVSVSERYHFSDEPRSLLNHFKILKRF